MKALQIYVQLLDEGTDAWRPVMADPVAGNFYRVIGQPYGREVEEWEFEPGSYVVCETIELSEGPVLTATKLATRPR